MRMIAAHSVAVSLRRCAPHGGAGGLDAMRDAQTSVAD